MARQGDRPKKGFVGRVVSSVTGNDAPNEPQSATDLLKSEHDEVRELFKEYKHSGENAHATRKRLIDEASDKLDVHAEIEEKIFYPACRELEDQDARKMVGESVEEHRIVKRLIKELRGLSGSDETFESKASVLMESVEHHADEEESDLFPAAEKEFDDEYLAELGSQMAAMKERLTKSPRPARGKGTPASGRRPTARS